MDTEQWPPEWQRGLIEFLVLSAVATADGPSYGYRIVQDLESAGFGKLKGGTLYPVLARFEAAGWISSSWGDGEGGPGRKFVELTPAGRRQVQDLCRAWSGFVAAVDAVVQTTGELAQ